MQRHIQYSYAHMPMGAAQARTGRCFRGNGDQIAVDETPQTTLDEPTLDMYTCTPRD